MIASLAALAVFAAPSVGDYFPTAPGTKWTYQETSDVKLEYSEEVRAPKVILGASTIPIVTSRKGQVLGANYYLIENDTVLLYAVSEDVALPEPQPFLKFGATGASWTFNGQTPFANGMLPIELKGTSSRAGRVKVLGEDRDALKVVIDAKLQEAGGLITIKTHAEAIYAKGIGMVEMTENVAYTKTKSTRKVKLISFEPPK